MRPYFPGGVLSALAPVRRGSRPTKPSTHRLQRGLPGYLILFAPHAFVVECQYLSRSPPSRWCSSRSLRISPLHREFHDPLRDSSLTVSGALLELSPRLSPQTNKTTYQPFTPNNSEQRLHPSYYRGCWHEVSRCFLWVYHHSKGLFDLWSFFHPDRVLQAETLPHSRGVAASDFRPLCKIPHCCLP